MKATPAVINQALTLISTGSTVKAAAAVVGLHRSTLSRHLNSARWLTAYQAAKANRPARSRRSQPTTPTQPAQPSLDDIFGSNYTYHSHTYPEAEATSSRLWIQDPLYLLDHPESGYEDYLIDQAGVTNPEQLMQELLAGK